VKMVTGLERIGHEHGCNPFGNDPAGKHWRGARGGRCPIFSTRNHRGDSQRFCAEFGSNLAKFIG